MHENFPFHSLYEQDEQYSEGSDVHKKPNNAVKPISDHDDPRRIDRAPLATFRNSQSPVTERAPSPAEIEMEGDISPRFESPNSVHSGTGPDDGPINLEGPPRLDLFVEQERSLQNLGDSPDHTPTHCSEGPAAKANMPRHDGPNMPQRFERFKSSQAPFDGAPSHIREPRLDGPPRSYPPSRYEGNTGGFDGSVGHAPVRFTGPRYDGPHLRFERPPFPKTHERPVRYNNPTHRPMRYAEPHNMVRYGEPQGPVHFDHPMHQNRYAAPPRFDNPPMPQGPPGYDEPRFPVRPMNYDDQQGAVRFDNPTGGMPFENPMQSESIRFDVPPAMPRYDQQGPPRFCAPNLQNQLRPQEPTMYDQSQGSGLMINPAVPPPNFNVPPMNSFGGPPQQFPMQPTVSQASNFSVPGAVATSYRPPLPVPGVANVPQPVSISCLDNE